MRTKVEPLIDQSYCHKRGDLLIYNPGLLNKNIPEIKDNQVNSDVILDVTISFPCAKSYVSKAAKEQGATSEKAYKDKVNKYPDEILRNKVFIPIAIESFGFFHLSIKPLISAFCSKASDISGIPHSVLVNYWINRLSATLHKHIARMMISRVDRVVSSLPSKPSVYLPCYEDFRAPY